MYMRKILSNCSFPKTKKEYFDGQTSTLNGFIFRVHYKNWNKRYDEWVELDRIMRVYDDAGRMIKSRVPDDPDEKKVSPQIKPGLNILRFFFAVTSKILRSPPEHRRSIWSLESDLSFDSICSVGNLDILEVIAQKSQNAQSWIRLQNS